MVRKLSSISKFRTLQPGQQIITIHILADISRSKDNQAMKFGRLIKYSVRNIFSKTHAENEVGSSRLLFVCIKALFEVKVSGQDISFDIFW